MAVHGMTRLSSIPSPGLLNTERQAFIGTLVEKAFSDFSTSLGQGERDRSRLLLRFIASLAVVNVVTCSSVVALLRSIVDGAIAVGVAGELGDAVCLSLREL